MDNFVLQQLRDFATDLYEPIVPRELDLGKPFPPRAGNLVKVITGMRRSGKSYRLLQEVKALRESGVPSNRICYFNFEDERLRPVTSRTGDDVLEAFRFLNPNAFEEGVYFFFDELQEMENWGAWLRRVVDTTRSTIYVTGSSSKMLSSEISTEFRGRALDFELLPFSFREYVAWKHSEDIDLRESGLTSTNQAKLRRAMSCYLREGGFPASFDLPQVQAVSLLQSYVQRVVSRDVIERHDFSSPQVVSLFAQRVLSLNGRQVSVRKISNNLKSAGLTANRGVLGECLRCFEEAYLVFLVRERSIALSESSTSMPKVYAIDPGLALANMRAATQDEGQVLEDAVYLELRRRFGGLRRESVTSLRTKTHGYEVDFAVGDAIDSRELALYQVSSTVANESTLERELRALDEAMGEQGISSSTLIVGEGCEVEHRMKNGIVVQVPAWKWFLGNEII